MGLSNLVVLTRILYFLFNVTINYKIVAVIITVIIADK